MSYIDDIKNETIMLEKEESKSMTGLEALEYITEVAILHGCPEEAHQVAFKSEIIEKELKALEVIKNTFVVIKTIHGGYFLETKSKCLVLTKDEYDLLKEIL